MRLPVKLSVTIAGICVLALITGYAFKDKSASQHASRGQSAQAVKTIVAQQQSMPITVHANAFVTALNTVDVRPQIQSIVKTIHVKEGQNVQAGELLFTLDDRSAVSAVAKAQAQVASNESDLKEAQNTLQRNQELLAQKFVSQSVVDTSRVKVDTLRSAVLAAQAELQSSKVNVSYYAIRASISGRIGAISVHQGSLAQPTGEAMVNIAQINPIAVTFSVPERELAYIVASYPNLNAPVTATLADKSTLQGRLVFIDNTADVQSGTIKMKAEFPNANRQLWPGTYLNVHLVSRQLSDAVVVPAQAVVTGPVDKFVYIVGEGHVVQPHKVDVLAIEQGVAAVAGIQAGVSVVVEGMQNLRPGSIVKEEATQPKEADVPKQVKAPV